MERIAKVAIEQTAFHFDKLYSYAAGPFSDTLCRGCRVLVPFGKGNAVRQGIVMELTDADENTPKLKPIHAVPDEKPILNEELLDLALFLKERTFCTVFDAVRTMLPTGLYLNVKPIYRPVPPSACPDTPLSPDETAVYKLALTLTKRSPDGVAGDKLLKSAGLQSQSDLPERLVKRGFLTRSDDAFRRIGDATQQMARLLPSPEELDEIVAHGKCSPKQKEVLSLLQAAGAASVKELCYLAGVTPAVVTALVKKQLVQLFEREILRSPAALSQKGEQTPILLNEEQQTALDGLFAAYQKPAPACALLYGVTGSGKTQVYLSLIDRVIAEGKQVIVLVPEISLTPQTMAMFTRRYGGQVAVLHSGLSVGERMDEWKRIRRGDARIVVGTRSAVFAPCADLGLIVMDEEQEHTYKAENAPRYHARDVAKFRSARHNALLLLASATPSVETYHAAKSGRYLLYTLSSRYGEARLPQVDVVDMRYQPPGTGLFSEQLIAEMTACLEKKKQIILLLNRRGYHTFLSCRSCGQVITCPSCSISMTYHRANGKMVCHYCGYTCPPLSHCPSCGSDKIRYSGQGTQRVEEELEQLFPDVPILRMDTDTTLSRFAYEEKFAAFAKGDYGIMIGTQMVAKGLDFPNVALVGVLSADQALYEGNFRSYETAFSLLTQVVGRAGRRKEAGKAVIQTAVPDHYVIALSSAQDYPAFYETEIDIRKSMAYPPFADLCQFGFAGTDERAVAEGASRFLELLKTVAGQPENRNIPLIALDPTPASVARTAGKYRYKILVKLKNTGASRHLIATLLEMFAKQPENRGVTVFADMNPLSVL